MYSLAWWRNVMDIPALPVLCEGNIPITGEFPLTESVIFISDSFLFVTLVRPLNKLWNLLQFESPWRSCDVTAMASLDKFTDIVYNWDKVILYLYNDLCLPVTNLFWIHLVCISFQVECIGWVSIPQCFIRNCYHIFNFLIPRWLWNGNVSENEYRHSQQVCFPGDNISFAIRESHDSHFPIESM